MKSKFGTKFHLLSFISMFVKIIYRVKNGKGNLSLKSKDYEYLLRETLKILCPGKIYYCYYG